MASKKKAAGSSDQSILSAAAPSLDQRLQAAHALSTKLASRFGLTAASVANPGLQPQYFRRRVFSTGLISLDAKLKIGGLPRGHITEFFGPPGGGKSTELLNFMAEVQHTCTQCEGRVEYTDKIDKHGKPVYESVDFMVKGQMTTIPILLRVSTCTVCAAKDSGGLVILCDQENSSDPAWMAQQGVELTKILVMKLPSGEITSEMVRSLLMQVKPEAICIDSIAQLQPRAEQERSDVNDPNLPGLHAKIMAKLCRHLTSIFTQDPLNAPAVVWVNQVRADMSGYNQPKVTGGFAPEHYSSIRLYFYPQGQVNQQKPELGRAGKITIYKARVAPGLYRLTLEYVLLPGGFDKAKDLYETAIATQVFNQAKMASGRYFYADADVEDEANLLARNREEMLDALRTNEGLYRDVTARVFANLTVISPPAIFTGDVVPGHEDEDGQGLPQELITP